MTLNETKNGQKIRIKRIGYKDVRSQALRLGLYEGAELCCTYNFKNGPVILKNRFNEVAVGSKIAETIEIAPQGEERDL